MKPEEKLNIYCELMEGEKEDKGLIACVDNIWETKVAVRTGSVAYELCFIRSA